MSTPIYDQLRREYANAAMRETVRKMQAAFEGLGEGLRIFAQAFAPVLRAAHEAESKRGEAGRALYRNRIAGARVSYTVLDELNRTPPRKQLINNGRKPR